MTTFQRRLQTKISTKYKSLNAQSKNLGGRLPLQMEVWATTLAGTNPLKGSALALLADSEVLLIPIDERLGDAKRWSDELKSLARVGDADIEIAAEDQSGSLLTREQLLGKDLMPGQQLRYKLGSDYYSIAPGTLADNDGLSWKLALVRDK